MLELEKLNLVEMNSQEVVTIDGGVIIIGGSIWKKFGWGYLASQVVDNWDDIKAGFREGFAAGNH